MAVADNYAQLVAAIARARATLSGLALGGPRRCLQQALAGYLWSSVSTAEAMKALVDVQFADGGAPLKRYLHETLLDVMYLNSDPDPDFLAAKIMLQETRGSRALISDLREMASQYPNAAIPPIPERYAIFEGPAEAFLSQMDAQNVRFGGTAALFSRAWAAWEAQPRNIWHWTARSRREMVKALLARGKLEGLDALLAISLTRIFNSDAHASPSWTDMNHPEGGALFAAPATSEPAIVDQFTLAAGHLLDQVVTEIVSGYPQSPAI